MTDQEILTHLNNLAWYLYCALEELEELTQQYVAASKFESKLELAYSETIKEIQELEEKLNLKES